EGFLPNADQPSAQAEKDFRLTETLRDSSRLRGGFRGTSYLIAESMTKPDSALARAHPDRSFGWSRLCRPARGACLSGSSGRAQNAGRDLRDSEGWPGYR